MSLAPVSAVFAPALSESKPRFSPRELREITRNYAAQPESWSPLLRFVDDDHWSIRVHADDNLDIWLITWLQSQSTSLHDHGNSAGAFTVVGGRLCEYQATGDRLEVRADSSRSFGVGYVHDVYNPYDEAAISIHAYSPPLTSMSYYEETDSGLALLRTDATTIPEGSPAP
jgi:hypothetical protein